MVWNGIEWCGMEDGERREVTSRHTGWHGLDLAESSTGGGWRGAGRGGGGLDSLG